MHRADRRSRSSGASPPADIAEILGHAASSSDRAIVVGNRAGIVEWANAAWTRMTGFPLSETISKPITDFLEQASIEVDLVDFVAQNFLDGRPSTIEFPFETFDARSIWVHLEVQPIRGVESDVSQFVATAEDISERLRQDRHAMELRCESDRTSASPRPAETMPIADQTRLSVSAETELVCERFVRLAGDQPYFDVALDHSVPSIQSNRLMLGEIIRLLIEAAAHDADENWDVVTVMTGMTEKARSHVSAAHPIPVRARQLAEGPLLYVEIHDTAATLAPDALDAIRDGTRANDARVHSLATASAMAKTIGGSLLVDSTPGCGTQALLLLPIC